MVKNKHSLTPFLISLVVLAVYCTCMFVLPLNRGGNFWSAFGFTVLAISLNAGLGICAFRGNISQNSRFLKVPVLYVSNGYALTQLLWGIAVVTFSVTSTISVIVSIILFGGCLVLMISLPTSEAVVVNTEQHISRKITYLKSLQLELAKILSKCTDATLKQAIEKLSESIRYSDPMSDNSLKDIEAEIARQISALGNSLSNPDEALSVCETIQQTLKERNERVKLLK